MTAAALPVSTARIWGLHLMCFVLPVTTLAFVGTGPHGPLAPLFLLPLVASVVTDMHSRPERRQPVAQMAAWPFDLVLYVLVAVQIVNILGTARLISRSGLVSADALVAVILVGVNSGYSAIVVAHELIHRSRPHMKLLGRLLMSTVLYEHFFTEHIRGHHARVGTEDDPATARFGESFGAFWLRTIPAQFRSAWALERERLRSFCGGTLERVVHNRIIQGLVAGWSIACALLAVFGADAFLIHVAQALVAVTALEAVNYFEHWGLRRASRRVRPIDSWDTDSRFTLYTLVGLSRHADHHAYASRPYYRLRHYDESPKLPYGYFGMVLLVWTRNRLVRRMLAAELRRRRLGPFANVPAEVAPCASARPL